jgi:aminopeptidase YwaD
VSGHLDTLCSFLPDRRPGSEGNRQATAYVAEELARSGWSVSMPEFEVTDWRTDGGELQVDGKSIEVTPSPYGLGAAAGGPIRILREVADLDRVDLRGSIVVLAGALAAEPLTPKAFPFYGSDEHAAIVSALEAAAPAAVLAATGKYPALCGALDPFPLIEDGDFAIPTATLRPADAVPLFDRDGAAASLEIRSERWRSTAANVTASRGLSAPRITVIAHIDTKPGTPGAVDNAAGVVVLLMLAELLGPQRVPDLSIGVELLAVNGEDHYAAPGELAWLADHEAQLDDISLVINIDGAGYRGGRSAYSTYNLDADLARHVDRAFGATATLVPGPEFYQSDHAIFAMRGRPAVAITTELVDEMLETLFHSPDDTPAQVDLGLVADIAEAIANLILTYPGSSR